MAAVIGDFISDPTRLNHAMIASPSSPSAASLQQNHNRQHQHHHHRTQHHLHQRREQHFRDTAAASPSPSPSPSGSGPSRPASITSAAAAADTATTSVPAQRPQPLSAPDAAKPSAWSPSSSAPAPASTTSSSLRSSTQPALASAASPRSRSGASRFPSPPSSSPTVATDDANTVSMASQIKRDHVSTSATGPPITQPGTTARPGQQQPSPPSDDYHASSSTLDATQTPASVQHPPQPTIDPSAPSLPAQGNVIEDANSPTAAQTVIHIRDLAHVQSLARAEVRAGLGAGTLNDPPLQQMKYEISGMPIGDIIEMVAALLTKITTTNDLQHDAMQRNVAHQQQASQSSEATPSHMSSLSHSVLAFHGKNVPAITILSYLSRIHRYCPTTYEVFLSLLVYFDRMTERVNERVTRNEEVRRSSVSLRNTAGQPQQQAHQRTRSNPAQPTQRDTPMRDDGDSEDSADESDSDLADDDDDDDEMEDSPDESRAETRIVAPPPESPLAPGPATYFVVDSFNIHRLIIAGVTCASKFFSDVFYTNSRYAKVGGLPLAELNHLELQFLVLNDFRLAVPVEDLEAYATMLVEFYAREVVGRAPGSGSRD